MSTLSQDCIILFLTVFLLFVAEGVQSLNGICTFMRLHVWKFRFKSLLRFKFCGILWTLPNTCQTTCLIGLYQGSMPTPRSPAKSSAGFHGLHLVWHFPLCSQNETAWKDPLRTVWDVCNWQSEPKIMTVVCSCTHASCSRADIHPVAPLPMPTCDACACW